MEQVPSIATCIYLKINLTNQHENQLPVVYVWTDSYNYWQTFNCRAPLNERSFP